MVKVVLSASRRTEILRFPDHLVKTLAKYPPEKVHTIVLWTKTPQLIFKEPVKSVLKEYNLFVLCTVTGLGGTFLEPNILEPTEVTPRLQRIIDEFLDGNPEKIHVRFDPILNLLIDGKKFTNLYKFPGVIELVAPADIQTFRVSWATYYEKVKKRLDERGIGLADFDLEDQARYLVENAQKYNIELRGCCADPKLEEMGIKNMHMHACMWLRCGSSILHTFIGLLACCFSTFFGCFPSKNDSLPCGCNATLCFWRLLDGRACMHAKCGQSCERRVFGLRR